MARLFPMVLIIGAITLLVLPGVLFNVYAAAGFKSADPTLACGGPFLPGTAVDVTCQGSITEGCQAVPTQCTLAGSPTFSFLNQNSPFTMLFTGNIFGLFSSLTSNGNANRGPFDASGGGPYYTADCFVTGITAGAAQNITTNSFAAHINACNQTNPDRSNMTKSQAFTWGDWNFNLLGASQVNTPFFNIRNNATYALTCYNQGYWFLTNQASVGYAIEGCDYYKSAGYSPPQNPIVNPVYSFLIGVPCNLGVGSCKAQTFPTGNTHIEIFVQPENWDTQFCTNAFTVATQNQATWYSSQQCTNMETWFVSPHGGGTFNFGFFTPMITILLGLALFLMGTGLNLSGGGSIFGTGTNFAVGINPQGTKLAQALGLALIIWSPLYSEFSTWFSSGLLPFGLDGAITSVASGGGITALAITGMLFTGVFWQTMSLE